ncbi:MAG: hypothetical protein ACSHW0_13165 [Thalassotalea sp.]
MAISPVTRLIEACTVNDKIDLKKICDKLKVSLKAASDLTDLCKIGCDEQRQLVIWINPKIDAKTRFTLVVIAIAELILQPERVKDGGISYDIFTLKDLHRKKHSPYLMLATRLAVPEHIIEKIVAADEMEFESKILRQRTDIFDRDAYINNAIYLPEFIRCVVRESSGKLLLDNIEYE